MVLPEAKRVPQFKTWIKMFAVSTKQFAQSNLASAKSEKIADNNVLRGRIELHWRAF